MDQAAQNSFSKYFHRDNKDGLTRRGYKHTKIIATLGPACDSEELLRKLYHAGMNVARMNMSHGDHEDHSRRLELVRRLSKEMKRPIAILADLQGPKIRLGKVTEKNAAWEKDDVITITVAECPDGNSKRVGCTYKGLAGDVKRGNTILVDDGKLRLEVKQVRGDDVECVVRVGGPISSNKGMNLPGVDVSAPSLSEKDKLDLEWAIDNRVEYIALSFVRSAQDIRALQRRMQDRHQNIPIIAKIERPEAVEDIDEILDAAHGIMVARGDLGIEIKTERLPVVQKHLIHKANAAGKVVITATQMLESMVQNPVPTRAESNDVANAIFDGSDVVMLSGETAAGSYPEEAVREMCSIAIEAESSPYRHTQGIDRYLPRFDRYSYALSSGAKHLAQHLEAKSVMVFSHGWEKGQIFSELRIGRPVVYCCYDEATWRRLSLYHGIVPLLIPFHEDQYDLLEEGLQEARKQRIYDVGDLIVVMRGFGAVGANSIKIVEV